MPSDDRTEQVEPVDSAAENEAAPGDERPEDSTPEDSTLEDAGLEDELADQLALDEAVDEADQAAQRTGPRHARIGSHRKPRGRKTADDAPDGNATGAAICDAPRLFR